MSVGNTNFQNTYTTDGTAGPWAFNWVYTEEVQVQVYLDLVLQSPSTYTVTKDLVSPGGTISFNAGSIPILGKALLIQRFANTLQTDTLGTNQELPPATLVRMADKLTIICQQISAQLIRALALPLTTIGFTATLPSPVAGAIPVVNAANNAMAWIPPVQAGFALIDGGPGLPPSYGPVTSASGGNVASSGASVVNNLAAFNNTGASIVKDSGIPLANVVQGPATATDKAVPLFNGATGKLLKDGIAPGALNNVLKSDGTNWISGAAPGGSTFTSSDQTITLAGALTLAHSLGAEPKFFAIALVCQTAQAGYSVGDITQSFNLANYASLNGAASSFASVWGDATNVNVRYDSAMPWAAVVHKTSGVVTPITLANWKARFYAKL